MKNLEWPDKIQVFNMNKSEEEELKRPFPLIDSVMKVLCNMIIQEIKDEKAAKYALYCLLKKEFENDDIERETISSDKSKTDA